MRVSMTDALLMLTPERAVTAAPHHPRLHAAADSCTLCFEPHREVHVAWRGVSADLFLVQDEEWSRIGAGMLQVGTG